MGCCGVVGTTRFMAVMGILYSAAVIVPPAVVFINDWDYSELLPFLKELHRLLEEEYEKKELTQNTLVQLRDFLNDISEKAGIGALVTVCVAGTNLFINLLLLIATCCRIRCLALPWLIFSMLEILILGCPAVIFFSLLGIYLYIQGLLIPALLSFSAPCTLVLLSLLSWLLVLTAYWSLGKPVQTLDDEQRDQEVQPLISNDRQVNPPTSSTPPTTYNLGHYPQFYPAQHATAQQSSSASAGPSAPPQTTPTDKNNPHLYPTLPV
ncbi:uncharacterized protein LOC111696864 [Eurytemora carolleeae]|uniref:uncharacterized protein LOC111696864 n=1 Tax=Eurytemora carolleeae TaxID=1294199 RepID=UPI000C783D4E|nr:uncharacterized protein LOC111696864 [Eurytemora carolleeae]|eukprot:XP_023322382.1 uncharacterized protein LOC111696864 [Eurytemora affinis]